VSDFTLMASVALVRALVTDRGHELRRVFSATFRASSGQDEADRDSLISAVFNTADAAASAGDDGARQELIAKLNRELQHIVSAEPGSSPRLLRMIFDELLPRLPKQEQAQVLRIQITASSDQVINHNFLSSRDHLDR
jgi:hypothetical protein